MAALISKRGSHKAERGVMLFGVGLTDAREEMFVVMVCDGLPLALAFKRAGFESKDTAAAYKLFHLPRVQERAAAILEARRTTGVVTLGEVTNMLQRVFAGANSAEEYSAAHNAAFSLARLYGHVNDKSTLEIIRRPSRDPDAPSEQMLEDWAASLPLVGEQSSEASKAALRGASAHLLGPDTHVQTGPDTTASQPLPTEATQCSTSNDIKGLEGRTPCLPITGSALQLDLFTDCPAGEAPGVFGNGAPARLVTGTPDGRAQSYLLGTAGNRPTPQNGSPSANEGTGAENGGWPSAEELFG